MNRKLKCDWKNKAGPLSQKFLGAGLTTARSQPAPLSSPAFSRFLSALGAAAIKSFRLSNYRHVLAASKR